MEKASKVKIWFTAFFTAVAGWLGILAIPVLILVILNVIDYVTGIMASVARKENISSYRGFKGIAKKICMWLLIIVGALMDWLLVSTTSIIGLTIPIMFLIAMYVTIWQISNEVISKIENMKEVGAEDKIPSFLKPIAKYIKKQVEDKAKIGDDVDG